MCAGDILRGIAAREWQFYPSNDSKFGKMGQRCQSQGFKEQRVILGFEDFPSLLDICGKWSYTCKVTTIGITSTFHWSMIHVRIFCVFYQKWLDPNQKTIESYLKPCQQILKPRAGGACSSPWVGMAALATAVGFTPTCCAKLSWHWATGRIVGWRCKKTSLGRCLKLEPLVSFGWMLLGRFGKLIFNSCRCDGLTFVFFSKTFKRYQWPENAGRYHAEFDYTSTIKQLMFLGFWCGFMVAASFLPMISRESHMDDI